MERAREEQIEMEQIQNDGNSEPEPDSEQELPLSIFWMVHNREVQNVQDFFQDNKHCNKVNNCAEKKLGVNLTCLESAVVDGHWDMAALLLLVLHADPKENKFEGLLSPPPDFPGYTFPEFGGKPIPGFQGLNTLVHAYLKMIGVASPERTKQVEKMLSFLSLMEWLLVPQPLNSRDDIAEAISNLRRLDPPKCNATIDAIKNTVQETNRVLLHCAPTLEDAVVADVLCHVAQNEVWNFFMNHLKDQGVQIP